jgi:hypothetical protein
MTSEQQAAFERLLAAQNPNVEPHASEVDQGGIMRIMRTAGSQDILKELFHTEVVHFERKKWPVLSDNQIHDGRRLAASRIREDAPTGFASSSYRKEGTRIVLVAAPSPPVLFVLS